VFLRRVGATRGDTARHEMTRLRGLHWHSHWHTGRTASPHALSTLL
jgi:hypothetical protein